MAADLSAYGPAIDPDSTPHDDALGDAHAYALPLDVIAPTAEDGCGSSNSPGDPRESAAADGFRGRVASNCSWWASNVDFADDAVRYAQAALEATTGEWSEDIRNAAADSAADPCGAPPRRPMHVSAEGYVRTSMLLVLRRIQAALDRILPITLLPDSYEVKVASVADLWQHLDALQEAYQECATDLSDVGRALQIVLVIGEPEDERWCD